jgi:rRNA maturation protein Rpf1
MGVIKGVLKEELENSRRMKIEYEKAVKAHPGGCIVIKEIKGRPYCYLAVREGKKVRFIYKGKKLSKEFMSELKRSKKLRVKYKENLKKLKRQIKFLEKALHGKEDV